MPDYSILLELCEILDISLNELFAGDFIKEKEIKKQSENNIIKILKFNYIKEKRSKIIFFVLFLLLFISFLFVGKTILIRKGILTSDELKYTKPYIINDSNIKGEVNINYYSKINIDFDIGANKYGDAVFKDPGKALKRLKKDYSEGLKLIQNEFNLLPLNCFNYSKYKIYGFQVTKGTKKAQEQARFVSEFMDIYENSFN